MKSQNFYLSSLWQKTQTRYNTVRKTHYCDKKERKKTSGIK